MGYCDKYLPNFPITRSDLHLHMAQSIAYTMTVALLLSCLHLGCFSLYHCNTVWRSLRIHHSGGRFYHRLVGSCIVPMCVDGNCGLCNLSPNMVWYTKRLLVCSDVFHYITKQFIFLSNKGC